MKTHRRVRIESEVPEGDVGYRESSPDATVIHRSGQPLIRAYYATRKIEYGSAAAVLAGISSYLCWVVLWAGHEPGGFRVFAGVVLVMLLGLVWHMWRERPWAPDRPAVTPARVRVDSRCIEVGEAEAELEEVVAMERVRRVRVVRGNGGFRVTVALDDEEEIEVLDAVASADEAGEAAAAIRRHMRT